MSVLHRIVGDLLCGLHRALPEGGALFFFNGQLGGGHPRDNARADGWVSGDAHGEMGGWPNN